MGSFEWANALAIRAAGVAPEWVTQTVYSSKPDADNASLGVSVDGALTTGIDIRTRENPTTRTMRVSLLATFDTTSDYRVVVDGTNNNVSGTWASWTLAVDGIIAGVADADVVLSREGTGDATVLLVQTVAAADLSFNFVVTSGTTTVTITADAETATLKFYGLNRGTNPSNYWAAEVNGEYVLDIEGLTGPLLDTSQKARLYCYAVPTGFAGDGGSVTPTVVILFGPSFGLTSEV